VLEQIHRPHGPPTKEQPALVRQRPLSKRPNPGQKKGKKKGKENAKRKTRLKNCKKEHPDKNVVEKVEFPKRGKAMGITCVIRKEIKKVGAEKSSPLMPGAVALTTGNKRESRGLNVLSRFHVPLYNQVDPEKERRARLRGKRGKTLLWEGLEIRVRNVREGWSQRKKKEGGDDWRRQWTGLNGRSMFVSMRVTETSKKHPGVLRIETKETKKTKGEYRKKAASFNSLVEGRLKKTKVGA